MLNCGNIKKILIFNYLQKKFMDHFEKKEQNYTKWNESIWLSVEKEISTFQAKVTSCMLGLGDLKKVKVEDFNVEPCLDDDVILGQDFYVELIRPICVQKKYLPKTIPTQADLKDSDSDSDSDSSSEEIKEEKKQKVETKTKKQDNKKEKKTGKKGGKNNNKNNEEQMKMKIVKENFLKDIELVLNSHSMERMQVQFGLKHKKLEVKLMTFFYVAYYIRANKEKQKIEESQIFQLINILIKIVRIFGNLKGKSFFSSDKKKGNEEVQVSPTLILDLKQCIKGLRDHYKYNNKKVIINYPKLVYYTNYDRFFPTLDIKPYPSQIQFIQAVKKALNDKGAIAHPTLVLYKTMIGSGKTSASLALSNLIAETKLIDTKNSDYQVLYSCLIGSVRVQVGRYAYNKSQKFALAAMQKAIKNENYYYPRIINSYSCRNEKVVDLVISDLDCTFEMLHRHHLTEEEKDIFEHQNKNRKKAVHVGKLEKENIVLFIDQPTAFCKSIDSVATQKLFDILANYPPKLIILASATMPDQSQLTKTIQLIQTRNPGLNVYQVQSKEFQIGCQYCSFKGEVIFPHTGIKSKVQLAAIIEQLERNPFLMRLYTGPSLFFLLKKCEASNIKGLPKIDELPQVRQADITKATFKILKLLKKEDDKVIQQICKLSADESNLEYKIMDEKSDSDDDFFGDEKTQNKEQDKGDKKDYVDFKAMLKRDAHKFLGGCLIGTDDPLKFAHNLFEKWIKKIKPVKRLVQKYRRDVQALDKQIKLLEDDKDMREEKKIKQISKLQNQKEATIEFPEHKKINTIDHYKKYCRNKESTHLSMLIKPVPLESVGEELLDEVDDFVLKLLFCGVALYMEKGLSPKYLDKVEELASQNYLAYIITDQSLCYGTNFPISNVVLCDELVCKLNMNEMFQLIGRAGRVGQSWTARAFLQQEGLKKLNNYIHNKDAKMSQQAQIFEQLAQLHLDNPKLTLRTPKSEIKYLDIENPDKRIEIIVKKKKVEDYHIFRKVCVAAYLNSDKVLCKKMPYESFESYSFPSSDILYEDLPTILNSHEEPIIDVKSYYKNEQDFIRRTLNNACKRIFETYFGDKLSYKAQTNEFKAKVYENFFSMKNNSFLITLKCDQEVSVGDYCFQKMKSNAMEKMDSILSDRLNKQVEDCRRLTPFIRKHPTEILANDVKSIKSNHENLMERQNTKFYRDIIALHYKDIEEEFNAITANITNKQSIQCKQECVIALTIDRFADMKNVDDKLFHIDYLARDQWPKIVAELDK